MIQKESMTGTLLLLQHVLAPADASFQTEIIVAMATRIHCLEVSIIINLSNEMILPQAHH